MTRDHAVALVHVVLEAVVLHELDALDDALEDADLAPDDRAAFRAHHYHALVQWYQTQATAVARWMTT